MPGIVDALTDDQVALLAQYYFLTRSKTEQDASLYAMQQQGYADEQVNAAKAEIADLLTAMNDQIVACYQQFMPMPQPVQFVSYIVYASVPGWCYHARCFVPEWYYDDGCFVGPCFNAAYAGIWGVPVCRAYCDHASRFYGRYHNVANTVYANHSLKLAKRNANWLRHRGNWEERRGSRPAPAPVGHRQHWQVRRGSRSPRGPLRREAALPEHQPQSHPATLSQAAREQRQRGTPVEAAVQGGPRRTPPMPRLPARPSFTGS